MYIWKQWKLPRTKVKNLRILEVPDWHAYQWGNTRLGYWRIAGSAILTRSITNKRLAQAGYFNLSEKYESFTQSLEPPYTERFVWRCGRSAVSHRLLPDYPNLFDLFSQNLIKSGRKKVANTEGTARFGASVVILNLIAIGEKGESKRAYTDTDLPAKNVRYEKY